MSNKIVRRETDAPQSQAAHGFKALDITPVPPAGSLGNRTNTEARRLMSELIAWAAQFESHNPEAAKLVSALKQVDGLFTTVWTEIDESLWSISSARKHDKNAEQHMRNALHMLHRWQDRGGRIGNVSPVERPHG